MANLFGKTILGIVAACVANGVAFAQEPAELFKEGVRLIRVGKPEEGLEKLREVIRLDPSNEQAFDLMQKTEVEVWQMLLSQKGEYRQIATSILDRARAGRSEKSRDEARIDELVQQAISGEYAERDKAMSELAAEHGEFAVPALIEVIGDPNLEEKIDRAMVALLRIGHAAVLPLIEATKSDNAQLRTHAAAALVHIDDRRAAPAFARLATDDSESVRFVAQDGLAKLGLSQNPDAVELMVEQSHAYLVSGGVRDGDFSEVVWSWTDQGLTPRDVPFSLYHLELAKRRAHEAVRIDPTNEEAKSLLARSYLAQVAAIEEGIAANPDDEALAPLANETGRLRMVAEALGVDTLRKAAQDAMAEGQSDVVIRVIESLGDIEERGELAGSPLVEALDSSDSRVAYRAALALANAAEGGELPAADKVVAVLGRAVDEEAIRTVLFVDSNPMNVKSAQEAASDGTGISISNAASGQRGVAEFFDFPAYDVVVVSDTLDDVLPEDFISIVKKRNDRAKILVLTQSEDAEERFGDNVDGFLMLEQGTLDQEALLAKVNEVVDELDTRRARATEVAIAAGHALRDLARADVAIAAAADSLAEQLVREDAVAIPAANALGEGGTSGQIDALKRCILSEDASTELKVACAQALGGIVARTGANPSGMFDELVTIVENKDAELELRRAVVEALGKAPLAPGARARLVDVLDIVVENGGSSD